MKWKEMSPFYKIVFVIGILCAFMGLLIPILSYTNAWAGWDAIEGICFGVFCLAEGIINWKPMRKWAIFWFILAGLRFLLTIAKLFT